LSRAHDAHTGWTELPIDSSELALHLVERLLPAHREEVALLVELAVFYAQERPGETVFAVEDLRVCVSLDAQQAAVDRVVGVALDGFHAAVFGGDPDPAANPAKPANTFVPAPPFLLEHR